MVDVLCTCIPQGLRLRLKCCRKDSQQDCLTWCPRICSRPEISTSSSGSMQELVAKAPSSRSGTRATSEGVWSAAAQKCVQGSQTRFLQSRFAALSLKHAGHLRGRTHDTRVSTVPHDGVLEQVQTGFRPGNCKDGGRECEPVEPKPQPRRSNLAS